MFIIKDTVSIANLMPGLERSGAAISVGRGMETSIPGVFAAGDCRGKPYQAAKAVGEKSIEMVHVKDINAVTGYIRGGCTPIGMKKQYKTVYHSTIKDFDKVIVSGGKLGTQIILAPDDLIKVTRADVCDIVKD